MGTAESALRGRFPRVLEEGENYKIEYAPLELFDAWRVWIIYQKEGKEHSLYKDIEAKMLMEVADPMALLEAAGRGLHWYAFLRNEKLFLNLYTGQFEGEPPL